MYHCHLLAHEDSGMMGQFVVVRPGESAGKPPANHDDSAHDYSAHDDSAHAAGTGPRTQGTHHDH
jgi:hypothetical protein